MAKYTSGRQKNIKVGLTSYSENKTSLEVVGKVGIGTTNATSSLYVVGDQFVTGIITASSFSGTATTAISAGSAKTATDVIGGIASVSSLFVDLTGISTLGTVKISSGIVSSTTGTAVTFFGDFVGTATSAGFAQTAFSLDSTASANISVAYASTAGIATFATNAGISTDVIGGIASVSQLSVSGFSTVGVLTATRIGIGTTNPTSELVVVGDAFISGVTTLGTVKISSGIITSTNPGFSTVTYFGDLKGNSDTTGKLKTAVNIGGVSFDGSSNISLKGVNIAGDQNTSGTAASAGNLDFGVSKGIYFRDISSSNATTSNNLTFDGNNLKVSGITTVGGVGLGNTGIKIDGTTGIISSSNPGVTTVTYYGTLIGTAQVDVTNVTNTSNVIGGIASVTELYVSGISTVGVLTATRIGIGTTNPTSELWVGGNIFVTGISTLGTVKISSGIITSTTGTAVTFFGDFVGTASSAGFAQTAFTLNNRTESQFNVAYASTAGIATFATKSGVATDVIGGIASVTSLAVDLTGISTLGTVKISSGIVTAIAGSAVTFFGTFVGTASSAGFAQTAFNLDSSASANIRVGFATTATDVIGGIGSLTQLSVSGVSTVGVLTASRIGIGTTNATAELFVVGNSRISGIVTIGAGNSAVVISAGIVTSSGVGTVTYFGNLTGTASTASFATTAFNLDSNASANIKVGFATTATNVIGGIASVTSLSVSGFSTVGVLTATRIGIGTTNPTSELSVIGNSNISGIVTVGVGSTGVTINGISGIITSSGSTIITYFGDGSNLTGIKGVSVESQAQIAQPVFPTLAVNSGVNSIGIATIGSTALSFNPSTGSLGIGTTNPTSKLFVNGNAIFGGTGIVTAVEYNGDLKFGTPSGGFKSGAVGIVTSSSTKDSVNEINSILGKLVPKPPTTIAGVTLSIVPTTTRLLCSGFTPTNNAGTGVVIPAAGTTPYFRNTGSISSGTLDQYGPGDSGTVTALLNNTVGVGTTTLSSGSNNGTFGALVISNDKDAVNSTRNLGIASGFYEVYNVAISNIPSASIPSGFNCVSIRQGTSETTKPFWYQDPSVVSSPILTSTTPVTPSDPVLAFSSGVPHYTESVNNAFSYTISCQNATGDMYTTNAFLGSNGATTGFSDPGSKSYTDFVGGTNPPTKDFGVGTPVTCTITQRPRSDVHTTVTTDATKFTMYTASTPYGNGVNGTVTVRPTIPQSVNIMGTSPSGTIIRENLISVGTLINNGTGSSSAIRTFAGAAADNPPPTFVSWDENSSLENGSGFTHEAVVRGGVLRHDQTNYSTGFLPSGPNYFTNRSGNQYFQVQFIRTSLPAFKITVTGTYEGCWVCMPNNNTGAGNWMSNLSGTNGWADMLTDYGGSGPPTTLSPGCAVGGKMDKNDPSSTTYTCTFGGQNSSFNGNGLILVRWKLISGQQITAMSFSAN
jgi:hypothetical protein